MKADRLENASVEEQDTRSQEDSMVKMVQTSSPLEQDLFGRTLRVLPSATNSWSQIRFRQDWGRKHRRKGCIWYTSLANHGLVQSRYGNWWLLSSWDRYWVVSMSGNRCGYPAKFYCIPLWERISRLRHWLALHPIWNMNPIILSREVSLRSRLFLREGLGRVNLCS